MKSRSLPEAVDAETPKGHAMRQMIGVLAGLECSLISERNRAGERREDVAALLNADRTTLYARLPVNM